MKNPPTILYDIFTVSGANDLLCTVDAAELKDAKAAHRAAGVKIRIKKRTVYDTIKNRQTAIRASRFAYLHQTVEPKPAPLGNFPVTQPKAHIAEPIAKQQTIFSSDLGVFKDHNWRPMSGTGWIHAIETINGVAIATDGVLVAIQRLDGVIFIGHLDNWVPTPKEPATPAKRASKRFEKMLEELLA